ncbi:MAG: choice-of-anchor J domain-containing protein [Muribaculaceae bacterium]|nr:choice-of-anchor J domain-containing protein [Muribaculaceae bacterium]
MKKFITLMLTLPLAVAAWGAQTPPCKLTFTSQEQFDQWKMVDANNDGQGSKYVFAFNSTEKVAYYIQTTKSYLPANDWIISPAITLTRGKQYIITVSVRNYSTSYTAKNDFNVSYGTAQTVEGQTTELLNVTGLKKAKRMSTSHRRLLP